MSWASYAIEKLQQGETVTITPHGNSMLPRIKSGQDVVVSPNSGMLSTDTVVLVKCKGNVYLHKISAIQGDRYQISNNHGHVNGWVHRNAIYGVAQI